MSWELSAPSARRWRGGLRRERCETWSACALRAHAGCVSHLAAGARTDSGPGDDRNVRRKLAFGGREGGARIGADPRRFYRLEAPHDRSEAEVGRSRRGSAPGCVSPTGARRDRPRGRPDAAQGGKRAQGSGIGAILFKKGWAALSTKSPPARQRRAADEELRSDKSSLLEDRNSEDAVPRASARGGRASFQARSED